MQVVYKKLLGVKPNLEDLKDLQPQVAKSLKQILDFDGDIEDTFSLTFQVYSQSNYYFMWHLEHFHFWQDNFQVSYDYFGDVKLYDLEPDGGNVPVTNENKEK